MSRIRRWTAWVTASALAVSGLAATGTAYSATARSGHSSGQPIQPPGDGGWKPGPKGKNTTVAYTKPAQRSGNPKPVKTDPHATRVKELTGKRTALTRSFQMSDGSVQQELSAVPLNYQDAKGAWQSVDTTVRPVAHGAFTAADETNTFQTYFSPNAGSLVRLQAGGASVQLGADGASTSAPKLKGSSVSYPGAWTGTDLTYQVGPAGLKESLVLTKAPATGPSYSFTLSVAALTPKQNPDGSIAFYGTESPQPVLTIPAPYMTDSKADGSSPYGKAYSTQVKQSMTWEAATRTLHVTETPDAGWLAAPARVYPVTVDPTIVIAPTPSTAANVMISADGPTSNYDTSWRLSVGTTTTGASRALIKFPMPSVPAGTTITSADLQLYYDQTFTTGSTAVPLQALQANAAWDPTTATWNSASGIGGPVVGTATKAANVQDVWNDFTVTSAVQAWLNGSANNGFVVKAASESPLGQGGPRYEGSIYAYGGEVVNYPKLVITYGVPGVTVNPPAVIHATGAELSWPAYSNTTGNSANDLAGYEVHRAVYQSFTPGANTEVSPVPANQTTFVDSTAVPTPANNSDPYGNAYYYMVAVRTKGGQLIPGPTQLVRLPEAGRTTLLIPAVAGTTLSSAQPATVLNTLNNGGVQEPWLEVGDNSSTYGVARSVFDFGQLSQVPANSFVLDAHLKVWQETTTTNTSGASYELHALTRSFTGSQATWNSAATGTAWTTPGGDYTAAPDGTLSGFTNDPSRRDFDATSIVQGWINTAGTDHGLLLKLAKETSADPQERTLFAAPGTAEPQLAPELVVTYLDASTGSTYYAPSTPPDMVPGTTYAEPVTINNTTTSTWAAASEVLTYHWQLPDGTDATGTSQLQTALPSDLAPGATVTLNAQVTPPNPGDGNQADGMTLAWDMYNKTTGTYLSGATTASAPTSTTPTTTTTTAGGAKTAGRMVADSAGTGGGIGSLNQAISVDPSGNNQLGLEKFYQYTTTPTGSGGSLYTNDASGDVVWNTDLFSNPSQGLSTFLRLSYNSLDTSDTTTGPGWSFQASTPARLGQALYPHPQQNPTTVALKDGTGNAHLWTLNTSTTPATWTAPPGVHLYLQRLQTCGPQDTYSQAWSMTRPDGTIFYYDCEGFPTGMADHDGNFTQFVYSQRQSQNKPEEFLSSVIDPDGRPTLTVNYYTKGGAYSYIDSTGTLQTGTNLTDPAIIDHVSSISDISGRTVDFYYSSNGLLSQIVDGAGTSIAKTYKFTYDATQGMKNVKLVAIQDPRGNTTQLSYYPTSSTYKWLAQSITDRNGHSTQFAYAPGAITNATTQTTVTDANTHSYVYQLDSAGRMLQATNPLNQTTTEAWDSDNNVTALTEANKAQTTWTYDQNTGYPLTRIGADANGDGTHYQSTYTYQYSLNGHIAYLTDLGTPGGRNYRYTYDGVGNVLTAVDPNGTVSGATPGSFTTTYTYDVQGDVLTKTDQDGHQTTYANYDASGGPQSVTDPMGNLTTYVYGKRGETTGVADPLGNSTTQNFDVFLRRTDAQIPKDQRHQSFISVPAPTYDANDNITSQTSTTGAVTSTVFDAMDQPTSTTLPQDTSTTPTRTVTFTYDKVGNRLTSTEPDGNVPNAAAGSYTTTVGYDADNQAITATDALNHQTKTDYDNVGNKIKITGADGSVTQFGYDPEHRLTSTTDNSGHTASVTYDPDGFKWNSTDTNGVQVVYSLDSDGHTTQVRVPHTGTGSTANYNTTQYTYDPVGNNTSVISPLGVASSTAGAYTTSTVYDKDDRKVKQLGAILPNDQTYGAAEQPETDYGYDAASRLTSVTAHTVTPYPGTGAQPSSSTATNTYTYYDNGWLQTATDPFSIITNYDYDNMGRQISRSLNASDGSAARSMAWTYYPDGKLHTYTDSGLPAGWQDQIIPASSYTTAFNTNDWTLVAGKGYNGGDYYTGAQPASAGGGFTWNLAIPQDGNYAVYVHIPNDTTLANAKYTINDKAGAASPPLVNQGASAGQWVRLGGATATYPFKEGSGQSVLLDPSGATVAADAIQLQRDNSTDTTTVPEKYEYDYDPDGARTDAIDDTVNAQYTDFHATFDQLDQMKSLVEQASGTGANHTLGFTYDPVGRVATQTYDSRIDKYTYDNMGRLQTVLNQSSSADPGLSTQYTYTPTGQPATETKANGNIVTSAYNSDGTMASSVEKTSAGGVVDSHTLGYDANNNITSDALQLLSAADGSTLSNTATRTYSPNNQVTGVSNSDGKSNQSYVYDSAGNVSEQTIDGAQLSYIYDRGRMVAVQNVSTTGAYQYDTLGRMHAVTNGNAWGDVNGISQQYDYDAFDNIVRDQSTSGTTTSPVVNTTTYTYDTINRPLTETLTPSNGSVQGTAFDYLGSGKTVLDETGSGFNAANKVYDYAPTGERLSLTNTYTTAGGGPGQTQTDFYTYDPHSDVEALTDAGGHTAATYGYTAYGADNKALDSGADTPVDPNSSALLPFNAYRFNSARIDVSTQNLDMGARTYDPNINRFVTRDAFSGSTADQALAADPYTGNRYGFAGGNPISNIEMDGHDWQSILGIGLAVGAVVGGVACTILTDGGCLLAIGAAAAEGAQFGAEGAIGSAVVSAIFEGGAAVGEAIGVGGAAGGFAAGAVALEEGAAVDLGAADAGAADAGATAGSDASEVPAADEAQAEQDVTNCLAEVGGESFTADTQVLMADGSTKAISRLQPGDKVKSADSGDGAKHGAHDSTVSDVLVHHDTDLYDLTVKAGDGAHVIHTTAGHLFYDRTQGKWVKASELKAGDELLTADGSVVTVVSGQDISGGGDMWDLTVPGDHDFYVVVGGAEVLVHNAGKKCGVAPAGHVYRGGQYKDLGDPATGRNVTGTEINHMPASQANTEAFGIPEGQGLAIQMDEADHVLTESWGSSYAGKLHRAHQMFLLRNGNLTEALQMDIDNIRQLFGTKYDAAITEMTAKIPDYIDAIIRAGKFQGKIS